MTHAIYLVEELVRIHAAVFRLPRSLKQQSCMLAFTSRRSTDSDDVPRRPRTLNTEENITYRTSGETLK
jgi:hypothetical protein